MMQQNNYIFNLKGETDLMEELASPTHLHANKMKIGEIFDNPTMLDLRWREE